MKVNKTKGWYWGKRFAREQKRPRKREKSLLSLASGEISLSKLEENEADFRASSWKIGKLNAIEEEKRDENEQNQGWYWGKPFCGRTKKAPEAKNSPCPTGCR